MTFKPLRLCELVPGCENICEGNTNGCSSHNRESRKEKNQSLKLPKKGNPIKKIGTTNTWICSNGERVTQAEINQRRDASYKRKYTKGNSLKCEGCGADATCSCHIIPQARCKQIGKTELIWDEVNYFPGCFDCNLAIENPKGEEWKQLKNKEQCLSVIENNDHELYQKFINA